MCVRARVYVCVCARACVRACVRVCACMRVQARGCACERPCLCMSAFVLACMRDCGILHLILAIFENIYVAILDITSILIIVNQI